MAAFSTAMIDSNLLKIAGAFVAGLAGIIGILGQTRTQDNKLTRSGKWLFGMAILGVVLAVGTQIWEWRKTIESNRAAMQRNEQVLQEIRRAVTRFQKVSVDWSITFQSTNKVFGSYIGDLAKLAEDALSKPWSFGFGRSNQGLLRGSWNPRSGKVSSFKIDLDSPAMPDEAKYTGARQFLLTAMPDITLFKKPISPAHVIDMWPYVIDAWGPEAEQEQPKPDLILKLNSGKATVYIPTQTVEPKVPSITLTRSKMDASVYFSSGAIVSVEDLDGCQGIIHMSMQSKEVLDAWNGASRCYLRCRVNDQLIAVHNLTSTQAHSERGVRPSDRLVYSFTFATHAPVPPKSDH